tara:strand:- start:1484 stop:1606 length:123 start_codon:yes stop_codon:yes gene_type:complete
MKKSQKEKIFEDSLFYQSRSDLINNIIIKTVKKVNLGRGS